MTSDTLIVTDEEAGLRLDAYLSRQYPGYSRTYFQTLIEEKLVLVNSELVKKAAKIESGDEVEIEFALTPEISLEPEAIPLDILYEDPYLLAVNKPAGMVVHPAVGNWSGTFVNALLHHCNTLDTQNSLRPGIVHRLDKETTGVLLAAKDEITQKKLVEAFANRQMHKEYVAICLGHPGNRVIAKNIGRHPIRRKEITVLEDKGKEAITTVETLAYNEKFSYVRLLPKTGRTHQLRVHLKAVGSPILGDAIYGNPSVNKKYGVKRQLLHAHLLRFSHPRTKEQIELKAPIPQDIYQFCKLLGYGDVDM